MCWRKVWDAAVRCTILGGLLLLAALAPAAAQDAACDVPRDEILMPIMRTHTLPPYPPQAVAANEQGLTLLEVRIAPSGIITDTTVKKSSGSTRLDSAAADHIRRHWRWNSLRCEMERVTRVSVNWDLKDAPDEPAAPNVMTFVFAAFTLLGFAAIRFAVPCWRKRGGVPALPRLSAPQLSQAAKLNLRQTINTVLFVAGCAVLVLTAYLLARWLNW